MPIIVITVGSVTIECETLDTPTAAAILAALPFSSNTNTWGDVTTLAAAISGDPVEVKLK